MNFTPDAPTWSLLYDWAGDEGFRDPVLAIVTAGDAETARQIAEAGCTTHIDGQPTQPLGDLAYAVATFRGDISAAVTADVEIVHLNNSTSKPGGVCGCPAGCPFCAAALDTLHDPQCLWQPQPRPHQPHRRPLAVDGEHTHRPGCPHIHRHPGPLFTPAEMCTFCGAVNTAQRDSFPSFGGTVEGRERCVACGQQWHWADLTAIV